MDSQGKDGNSLKALQYKGYLIPEGASVFGDLRALWPGQLQALDAEGSADAVYHDSELLEDPNVFNPDRYLVTPHGTRPGVYDNDMRSTFIFGYGRVRCLLLSQAETSLTKVTQRICPGMHLATVSAVRGHQ